MGGNEKFPISKLMVNLAKNMEKMNNIKPLHQRVGENMDFPEIINPTHQLIDVVKEQHVNDEEYFKSILLTLKNIEQNTAGLNAIVELMQTNSEHQKQIIDILQNIVVDLASAKTTEQADSTYRKISDKINSLNKLNANTNAILSLQKHLMTVYETVKDYL